MKNSLSSVAKGNSYFLDQDPADEDPVRDVQQ